MTSAQLWEQVDAFMSESVEKKLEVEKMVPKIIGSNIFPVLYCAKATLLAI